MPGGKSPRPPPLPSPRIRLRETPVFRRALPGVRSAASRGDEAEMLLHRSKIAVVMQQGAATLDAKRRDDDVRGLANRDAEVSQLAIIPGGSWGEIGVEKRHEIEAAQAAFDARRMSFVPGALKDFEQNEVADQYRLAAGRSFELDGRHGPRAAKMGDPDRAVDEDHNEREGRCWRISPRSPSQPNPLSAFSASACLWTRTSSRSPYSTAARLVESPVSLKACAISLSSISMFVRMEARSRGCV